MSAEREANAAQADLWNGAAGRGWVEMQEVMDGMFEPVARWLLESSAADAPRRMLDVGCGTGALVLAFARRGVDIECAGVDISRPMIELARSRAARANLPAQFVVGDAQTHAFERASRDLVVSRFGVMFFDDPARALANLRAAARPGAKLDLVVWRSAGENPFMTIPEQAAAPLLPPFPPRDPAGPGQFAWAERAHVRAMLEATGWTGVEIRPVDFECVFATSELPRYFSWVGSVGRALQETDEATRHRVIEVIRTAVARFVAGDEVRFTAACWSVRGRSPD